MSLGVYKIICGIDNMDCQSFSQRREVQNWRMSVLGEREKF